MSKPEWKTSSLYATKDVRTSEITSGGLRIIVTRRIENPERWHLLCYVLGFDKPIELKSQSLTDAQAEAVDIVEKQIQFYADMLKEIRR